MNTHAGRADDASCSRSNADRVAQDTASQARLPRPLEDERGEARQLQALQTTADRGPLSASLGALRDTIDRGGAATTVAVGPTPPTSVAEVSTSPVELHAPSLSPALAFEPRTPRLADDRPGAAAQMFNVGNPTTQLGKGDVSDAEAKQADEIKRVGGFEDSEVKVAGAGGAGADITAHDGEKLWVFEVKGSNRWMSRDNISSTGNVPMKQLVHTLGGKLEQNVTVPDDPFGDGPVSVGQYIADHDTYLDGRQQILLGASHIDIRDALLALPCTVGGEGSAKLDMRKSGPMPLSVTSVGAYLRNDDMSYPRLEGVSLEDILAGVADARDAREYIIANPDELRLLEEAYTKKRQSKREGEQQELHGVALDSIPDEVSYKFLPVVGDLRGVRQDVAAAETPRPAPRVATPSHAFIGRAVQLIARFDDVAAAKVWLRAHITNDVTEDNSWQTLPVLLDASPYGGQSQYRGLNLGRLNAAYQELLQEQHVEDVVAQRDAVSADRVTPALLTHVTCGEVNGQSVTGYHWIGLGDHESVVAETTGEPGGTDDHGVYHQGVRNRATHGVKGGGSSFFPDNWTLHDLKAAINYAEGDLPDLTVTIPPRSAGMAIHFVGDTCYPVQG